MTRYVPVFSACQTGNLGRIASEYTCQLGTGDFDQF